MIINGHSLLAAAPIISMVAEKRKHHGISWGLTECGYDIRIKENITLFLGRRFVLTSSIEEFDMPDWLMGRVLNKSTWARLGLDASCTTNIEPGWKGHLTIELTYSKILPLHIPAGVGIAQIIFEEIKVPTSYPQNGKYQNQANEPVAAIFERESNHDIDGLKLKNL